MHWKSQFISSKHSFFVESFKLKITFSLNSTDHFCAYPGMSRGSKTFLFLHWGKEEPGDPVPKADKQFKGFPGVKNGQVEMHKYVGKADQGSHLPISSCSGGSQGRRWHWSQTNRGHGRWGGAGRVYLLPAEQICQPPVKHMIIVELHVLRSAFILPLF